MKWLLALVFSLLPLAGYAVVIEPDDYTAGTNLSAISPHATLSTTSGGAVYAAPLRDSAADGYDTLGLGKHVFGWEAHDEWQHVPSNQSAPGLAIVFSKPVTYISLLVAELFPDAGPGSDPVFVSIYDTKGNLLSADYTNESHNNVRLGRIKNTPSNVYAYWSYWSFEFSAAAIGKIVIGGDSEPTTLDRLEFTLAILPEPSALTLLLLGLFGLGLRPVHKSV
jgi:hypothetical protein